MNGSYMYGVPNFGDMTLFRFCDTLINVGSDFNTEKYMKTNAIHYLKKSFIMTIGLLACALYQPAMALNLGYQNTASNLDLSVSSLTDTVLTVSSTNNAVTNTVTIGSGQEFRINGNVTVGTNVASIYTSLVMSGGGSFVVTNNGGSMLIGAGAGGNKNAVLLNMGELNSFKATLGTSGNLKVGDVTTGSGWGLSSLTTMILATNSTVTVGTITLGPGAEDTTCVMKLGNGTNVLNVNTVNIGCPGRSSATLNFNSAGQGTLKIRGCGGTDSDRANINMGIVSAGTSYNSLMDMTGHTVNLLLDKLIMSEYSIGGKTSITDTNTFNIDTGTMDVNDIMMGRLYGASTWSTAGLKKVIANLNLNGGVITINNAIVMATNNVTENESGHTATATLNVTGSSKVTVLNLGNPSYPAITLAVNTAIVPKPVATGTLNVTNGGTLTVYGNIVDGGNSASGGVATTTINLKNGTLLMPNHAIVNVDNFMMTNAMLAVGVYAGIPAVTNRGTGVLAPGGTNVVGSTIISNSYVQASMATLDIDLVSKLSYDRVTVTGNVTLEGTVKVKALPTTVGDFDILTSDVGVNDTSTLDEGAVAAGFKKTLVNDGKTVRISRYLGTCIYFL